MAAAAAPPEAASARCGPTDLAGVLDLPRALAEQVWGARNLEGAAQKKEERHREAQGAFQDIQDWQNLESRQPHAIRAQVHMRQSCIAL